MVLLLAGVHSPVWSMETRGPLDPPPAASDLRTAHPIFSTGRDVPILVAGAAVGGIAELVHVRTRTVPSNGLDPARIHLAMDRRIIGDDSDRARRLSNLTVSAATAWPFALVLVSAPSGDRLRAPLQRVVPYLEATMLSDGLTNLVKRSVSRPRPYLYLAAAGQGERTVTSGDFLSFPSAHASHAWTAASFAMTDHLLSRPHASWEENAAVGFAGGSIAAVTSYLRVRAGEHFPTDVIAGGLLGLACGAAVPLLHEYRDGGSALSRPSAKAWLESLAGMGTALVLVLTIGPSIPSH